jgi:quercetin dioxygenase-like cupin family protein
MAGLEDRTGSTEQPAARPHANGQTSGTVERPAQSLTGTVLAFDLATEVAQLRAERGYREGERNAKTLVKAPDSRIVLTALRAGARVQEHHAAGRVAIQTISGRLRLQVLGQTLDLPAGHLLALEPDVSHDVEALEESAFLLTLAWPRGTEPTE